jgi:hypothetical protein
MVSMIASYGMNLNKWLSPHLDSEDPSPLPRLEKKAHRTCIDFVVTSFQFFLAFVKRLLQSLCVTGFRS